MVVDGRIGFIGGAGIADDWRGTHFRVEGPVVAQIQSAFIDNWLRTSGEALHGDAFLPALQDAGSIPAQVVMSSPRVARGLGIAVGCRNPNF
ncbi:phospholipase D-like domain-containing protein [Rhodoferax antarcticus]|uniref:phospholipase D-like domain-containing protein n=1 Tax=Rhodoferax antarcticus TaxID=81479 RepID=UPI0022250CEC|nr:hypothetical protein [Rhodoferax antarcticus]MCW2311296.1 phosphatidylserine/phosphatidylglycerophosphate/cardiolipin synthase-like enzyme [Rhodoferax antarcticus]